MRGLDRSTRRGCSSCSAPFSDRRWGGWTYLPLVVPPLAAVLTTGAWRVLPRRVLVIVTLAAAGLYAPLEQAAAGQPSSLVTLTMASVYFWSSAALWAAGVALARRVAA